MLLTRFFRIFCLIRSGVCLTQTACSGWSGETTKQKTEGGEIAYKEENYDRESWKVDKEAQEILSAARKKRYRMRGLCWRSLRRQRRGSPYYRACQCPDELEKRALDDMKTGNDYHCIYDGRKSGSITSIDTKVQEGLSDETLKEMGDHTWLSSFEDIWRCTVCSRLWRKEVHWPWRFFEAAVCVVDSLWANEEFGKLMNHQILEKKRKIKIVEGYFHKRSQRDHRMMSASHQKGACRKICVPCSNILSDAMKRREEDWRCPRGDSNWTERGAEEKLEQKLFGDDYLMKVRDEYDGFVSLGGSIVIRIQRITALTAIFGQSYELSEKNWKIQL